MSSQTRNAAGAILALALPFFSAGNALAMARPPKPAETPPAAPAATEPARAAPVPGEPAVAKQKPAQPAADSKNAQVAVLGYHRFVQNVRRPDTEITPADFEAQMQQLKEKGVTVIPMRDLLAWKRGEKEIPQASAVITLDDGWSSQYHLAWPILKKFGYPFTMFIYTDYVKGGRRAGGESLSWEQLAELRDAGVNIESHTASHADLRGKKAVRGTPEYDAWLWNELHGSKELLEQHLGIKVRALALPYGFYNEQVRETAKKAGYEAIFTVNGQKIDHATSDELLGRFIIDAQKPQLFAGAVRFDTGGGTSAAPVAHIATGAVVAEPADGSTIQEPKPVIKANVKPFEGSDPGSLVMRVSGIGVVDARYDPASGTLAYQPPEALPEATYTVIVSGTANGKKQEARWAFTVGPKTPPAEPVAAPPGE